MKKKTFQQFLIVCVIAITVYYVALGVAATRYKNKTETQPTIPATIPTLPSDTTTTQPLFPTESTAAPATTLPTQGGVTQSTDPLPTDGLPTVTTQTAPTAPTAASVPTEPSTAALAVPSSKADIVAAYVNAVNQLKATPNFTLNKSDRLNVVIDEMDPESVRSFADSMISSSQKTEPKTYRFTGGSDPTSGSSVTHVVAPIDRNAALSPSAVTEATATPTGDGGYRIHLTLGTEKQTMNSPAPNYSTVMEVLDTNSMGLPSGAKIDNFNITYSGGTIDATLDSQGRITAMTHHLIVPEATGSGSYMVAVTMRLHGDHTATYQITY